MEQLFEKWSGEICLKKNQLSANGSNRIYYRLEGESKSCIATINQDITENEAFFFFAEEMRKRGVNVPEVYAISDDRKIYMQQDLGNISIYTFLNSRESNGVDVSEDMRELYKKAIDQLVVMQNVCRDIDFSHSYPRPHFDRQAIQWDLNYFKYYFLRLFHIPFDEDLLEKDFSRFIDYLLDDDCTYFMFRDFQSRNIMLVDDELYFIDFQGARQGAPHYDLASLLYSSKSNVPEPMRKELLEYYIDRRTETYGAFNSESFRTKFYSYVLARIMQAMGAYGFRGVIEKKEHFVKSIPYAVENLGRIIEHIQLPIEIPHLKATWQAICNSPDFNPKKERLTVSIFSFSYRKGIPFDKSGNGGGYVFDCRALPNPGLIDKYKPLCGRDTEVIEFFEEHPETEVYLEQVRKIVGFSVESYLGRGYTRLMINFGCTGGRHRSVYCAEQIAKFVHKNYDCDVSLHHLEYSKL